MVTEKIARNATGMLASEIISNLLGFFFIVVLTQKLGDVGLGIYSFAFSFIIFFYLITDLGLPMLYTRDVSRNKAKANSYFSKMVSMKFFIIIIVCALYALIIYLLKYPPEKSAVMYMVCAILFLDSFNLLFEGVYGAFQRTFQMAMFKLIERFLSFTIGIIALKKGEGLATVVFIIILTRMLLLFLYWVYKDPKFKFTYDVPEYFRLIKLGIPFWFMLFFSFIYFKTDTVMLSFMKGDAVVGWYNAAVKLISALNFIPIAIGGATFPVMSLLFNKDKKRLNDLLNRVVKYLLIIGLPIAFGATILATRLIDFIYGNGFTSSGPVLQIMIWGEIFLFLGHILGFFLSSINKAKYFTISTAISAVLNIALNFILIPKYSLYGAAVASLISQALNYAILHYYFKKSDFSIKNSIILKPLLASIFMSAIVLLTLQLPILIIICIAAAAYFAFLLITKTVNKEDIDIAKSLIYKK